MWLRSRSLERFKISVTVHLDDISLTAEPFVTKLGLTWARVSYKKTGLLFSGMVFYLQGQGHSESSYNQI